VSVRGGERLLVSAHRRLLSRPPLASETARSAMVLNRGSFFAIKNDMVIEKYSTASISPTKTINMVPHHS